MKRQQKPTVNQTKNQNPIKPSTLINLTLLTLTWIIIAARCQINEAFPIRQLFSPPNPANLVNGEITTMLIFATLIAVAATTWLTNFLLQKSSPQWRKTALGVPLLLITIAAAIAITNASNKHTAVIAAITLLTQILLAIILVQLLDSPWKIRFTLCVIVATAAVMAHRCYEQYQYEIPSLLQQFHDNPNQTFKNQNLEPGTYNAIQFQKRIESRDVGGFFAISNTAAAFFILTLTATAALYYFTKSQISNKQQPLLKLIIAAALIIQLLALAITKSKGGFGGLLAATILAAFFYCARRALTRHHRLTIIIALITIALIITAVAAYGLQHNSLPTASMHVRWQYWHATAKMIADHLITGVGPENFGQYYPRYMDPAAPEVVKDPHCFFLALFSQYGILSIAALLIAAIAVTHQIIKPQPQNQSPQTATQPSNKITNFLIPLLILIPILIIRRATSHFDPLTSDTVRSSIYLLAFAIPAAIWLIATIILNAATSPKNEPKTTPTQNTLTLIILAAGILGFLIHNSIDFAIFQPGVGTLFFTTLAILIAVHHQNPTTSQQPKTIQLLQKHPKLKLPAGALAVTLLAALIINIVVPFSQAQTALQKARQLAAQSQIPHAVNTALIAAQQNPFDPTPYQFAGEYQIALFLNSPNNQPQLLQKALANLQKAIQKDPQKPRNYRRLAEIYQEILPKIPQQQHNQYLNLALDAANQSLQKYPGQADLLIQTALIQIQLNQIQTAKENLQKALQIERDFCQLQKQLYPQNPAKYRLKPQLLQLAQQKLQQMNNINKTPTKPQTRIKNGQVQHK